MTEASCAEIDVDLTGQDEVPAGGLIGEERKHEVLKEPTRVLEMHVYASCGVGGLLEENGIAGDFTDINRDFLSQRGC